MAKKPALAIALFVAVCLMGVFVALAGGTRWGTPGAGAAAFFTFMLASAAALMTLLFPEDL